MESIEDVIGTDLALELTFDSRRRLLSAEVWSADLHLMHSGVAHISDGYSVTWESSKGL